MPNIRNLILAAVSGAAFFAPLATVPASAGDDFNDWSCKALWEERNQIYKDNGYCFHTARAIKRFGNAGCEHDSESDVPLSKSDRSNVRAMKRAEAAKGC